MNIDQLNLIEVELGITVPKAYRDVMLRYPFSKWEAAAGMQESRLYDDVSIVLKRNRQYHDGFVGMDPWPKHLFYIGDDGAANCYALDLSNSSSPVYFVDHGNCKDQRVEAESLAGWVEAISDENDGDVEASQPVSKTNKVLWLIVGAILSILFLWLVVVRVVTGKPP